MSRATIDFGIDLGTTNSAIAVLNGRDVEVIKNNENLETTSSAVWIDKKGKLFVGRRAKDRIEEDQQNAFAEFKLLMGRSDVEYDFAATGRKMRPEQLSAEVLKSLRADVEQRTGEVVEAAVITVPAAFDTPQNQATKRAAELAGLRISPILQEPIAAALAYGFQSETQKAFWTVFDFGGGTFDAAIMQVRDGAIQVVNHAGDNHLGGKLIDWAIVEQVFIPALTKEYLLEDFRRGNKRWTSAIAKLKQQAEIAKIALSREVSTDICIDYLCKDDNGSPVEFNHTLTRREVEQLALPFFRQAINITRRVLEEKRLKPADIERVLLVGGPSLMPALRQLLEDPKEGLGVPLDFKVDPLTVVARGAAVFAGSQRLEQDQTQVAMAPPGACQLDLEYQPVGNETEPLVGGRLTLTGGGSVDGYTIEFINEAARPAWRSGKIPLTKGAFMTTLVAERGRASRYRIEVCDAQGRRRDVSPDTMTYTVGVTITNPPLTATTGVAMANNQVDKFFDKGAPLPLKRRVVHRTAFDVQRGDEILLRIPVVQGENLLRADRNRLVGVLEVPGTDIARDVPSGSEVEIEIEMTVDGMLTARAYVPLLDRWFESVSHMELKGRDADELAQDIAHTKERLQKAREAARETGDPSAKKALQEIEEEGTVDRLESAHRASATDEEARDQAQTRLVALKSAVDRVELANQWLVLVKEATEALADMKELVGDKGTPEDKDHAATLERELRVAMESRDPDLLERKMHEARALRASVLLRQPGFWVGFLHYLESEREKMRDQSRATTLFRKGHEAIENNNLPALRSAVEELRSLMPDGASAPPPGTGFGGTTHT
jgi:molecular chaperone DnaK